MEVQVYENVEICAECKGECCKALGCHFSPTDFDEISFDALKAEIDKGFISIDWWDGDVPEFFLRMRNKYAPIVDPSWGGVCMLLTDKGCPLPFEKRPLGARALKPGRNGCTSEYGKYECKEEWLEYSDILWELYNHYQD